MLIHRLKLSGLLSFGPEGVDLAMEPLKVLIGPDGSGKSNFLEAIGFPGVCCRAPSLRPQWFESTFREAPLTHVRTLVFPDAWVALTSLTR